MTRRTIILGVMVVAMLMASGALAAPGAAYDLVRGVWSGGGARRTQGDTALVAVIGQPVAGVAGYWNLELCAGLLCGMSNWEDWAVYLPVVMANP